MLNTSGEKFMGGRGKDKNKFKKKWFRSKINPQNVISPLLDGNGKILINDAEKTDVFNKYLYSVFG